MPRLTEIQRKILKQYLMDLQAKQSQDVQGEVIKLIDSTDEEITMRIKLYAGEKITELQDRIPQFDDAKVKINEQIVELQAQQK